MFERSEVALEIGVMDGPLFTLGDPTRLAQVIGNLLSNAAKFTPRGGHAHLSIQQERPDAAIIRVHDDGAGIPEEMMGRLFEPFVQADQTLDRSKGGIGLGLAMVKGILELHGGTVSARSEGVGKGLEITVRLPLGERAKPMLAVVSAPQPREEARRVLVIEDNVDAAESLKEALELGGHVVELAFLGLAGIERSRALRPDVIVCDIGLPGMDGYAVAMAIRADPVLRGVCLAALRMSRGRVPPASTITWPSPQTWNRSTGSWPTAIPALWRCGAVALWRSERGGEVRPRG